MGGQVNFSGIGGWGGGGQTGENERENDYDLFFNELLEKDGSFTLHHCNIQALAVEMFKLYKYLSEANFSDILLDKKMYTTFIEIESFKSEIKHSFGRF